MARLPSSFRRANRTTRRFREQHARLPAEIKKAVRDACVLFHRDSRHPSLRWHVLEDRRSGGHLSGTVSVSVTRQYRALYFVDDKGVNVWYWIGTHAEYDHFTGG